MPMAAIPKSTRCSASRRSNSTTRSATAVLHKMQQLVHERAVYAPIWLFGLSLTASDPGSGNLVYELIPGFAYTAPYEDITLKSG